MNSWIFFLQFKKSRNIRNAFYGNYAFGTSWNSKNYQSLNDFYDWIIIIQDDYFKDKCDKI